MNAQLYCGDCLQIMPSIADGTFDAIITDPPYNVSREDAISRNGGKFGLAKDISLDFGDWDKGQVLWRDFIDHFARLLRPNGVLVMFYDKLELGEIAKYLRDTYGFKPRHIGVWVKRNPAPQARKVKWQNGTEFFLVATKNDGGGHHFNYSLGQSPDYFITSVNYKHEHPTQKPLELMEWIVSYWTFDGDAVLDPFMGAGTTGVACVKLGRNFVGIERDTEFFNVAKARITLAEMERPLGLLADAHRAAPRE